LAKKRLNRGARKSRDAVKSNPPGDNMSKHKTTNPFWKILIEILRDNQMARNTVSACLLIAMFLFMVVAVFRGMMKPDIIASAFTLILGYFFGHIASGSGSSRPLQ
jgi:hypothetical protein